MPAFRSTPHRQRGVTLTELMIALVVGALVVLAATAMVVSSRGTYRTQDESTRLAESARFALELGNRLVRIAGYTNFGNTNFLDPDAPPASYVPDLTWSSDAYSLDGPQVVGANDSTPSGAGGYNGSDSLVIRFFGSNNTTGAADGNILDCAGTAVPEPKVAIAAPNREQANRQLRAYNALFVATDTDGEPALKCQRQTYDAAGNSTGLAPAQTLIRGVEDFQVLYGEAIPQPSPNDDLDRFPPATIVYRSGIGGPNAVGNWGNVRSVRIAMLLRSGVGARPDPESASNVYYLFGTSYPAGSDAGAQFALTTQNVADRTRMRRVVETTVFIRNRMREWTSVNVN